MHCLQHFWNSYVVQSAHTTKSRAHLLFGFENLAVDFVKFSNVGETFFIGCFTVTDDCQSNSSLISRGFPSCPVRSLLLSPQPPGPTTQRGLCGGESRSKEYFLIISAKPELKLGQHLFDGRIVTVNTLVIMRHRRN